MFLFYILIVSYVLRFDCHKIYNIEPILPRNSKYATKKEELPFVTTKHNAKQLPIFNLNEEIQQISKPLPIMSASNLPVCYIEEY